MTVRIVINESHQLLPSQLELIEKMGESYEFVRVPQSGWTLSEMKSILESFMKTHSIIVFVSPVPYLVMSSQRLCDNGLIANVLVFHNDNREKVELPDGKIIYRIPRDGWILVDSFGKIY